MVKRVWGFFLVVCLVLTLTVGSVSSALAVAKLSEIEWLEKIPFTYGRYTGFGSWYTSKSGEEWHTQDGFGIFCYNEKKGDTIDFHGIYVGYASPKPRKNGDWGNSREGYGVYVAHTNSDEIYLLQAGYFNDGELESGYFILQNEARFHDYVYKEPITQDGRQKDYYGEARNYNGIYIPDGYGILHDPENREWTFGLFMNGEPVIDASFTEIEGKPSLSFGTPLKIGRDESSLGNTEKEGETQLQFNSPLFIGGDE